MSLLLSNRHNPEMPPCGGKCCGPRDDKKTLRRRQRRRENQNWKRNLEI